MPSKHARAGLLIPSGLYDNLHSFAELEQRISALGDENTKAVGDAFEVFVEGYLATDQKMQVEAVWLVGQVPLDIRHQLNLPSDTKGIDGIFRTRTGTLVPYQVKFRSQRAYLTYTEIAPFLGLTERATDRIVFTNSNELAEDVKNRDAMRTVRGTDFDDLTEEDLRAISGWLREEPRAIPKLTPRPYQIEALARIGETLSSTDRAHVVMACGTGKTLIALWATEALKPKTVLVLVPSLTLLQQTLDEWSRNNNWGSGFSYICVCSDPTVTARDANDQIRLDPTDLDFRVYDSPDEVRGFIEKATPNVKVVFSTYQSSAVVAQGIRGLAPFDIAIFDEAHKTTGPQGGAFAHGLSDANIRIRKRLFFTATPRHYDIRHRDKEGGFRVVSMDDAPIYGPRAYSLTFGSAARQDIICNYKVVISVVDGREINDFALKHGVTLVEADLIRARWVANQIAIERAIERTGAKRAITFHSRVSSAREFGNDTARGVKRFLPTFSVFHVNGEQRSSERKQLLRSFRDAAEALVTNARCLTEGIDVPAVDMVAFIDPRHSKIDIAQATGRAMRKPRGSDKEVGYVVIPLFLERANGETLEAALTRSDFGDVVDVLNAMQEQDEDLVQIIRELQEAKGHGEIFDPRRLTEKIDVVGPSIELSTLRSSICAEIASAIGVSWDEWYGRLKLYVEREGHCRVPALHQEDGYRLGQWVGTQRRNKDTMPIERRQRLDTLWFVWNPFDAAWDESFRYLEIYREREGHCCVPTQYAENGFQLGTWVSRQRRQKDRQSPEHRQRLDALGFIWNRRIDETWEDGFRNLIAFMDSNGHCRVPSGHVEDGFQLGTWVARQRQMEDRLTRARRQRLDALGFVWDALETKWDEGFHHLEVYKQREGHCCVPRRHSENGFRVGAWVSNQRLKRDTLSPERRRRLDALGFVWDAIEDAWEEGFRHLTVHKEREGHCRVPRGYIEADYPLGPWVTEQRKKRDELTPERRERLNALGFVWYPFAVDWEQGCRYLAIYSRREGHCQVPFTHVEDGFPLGQWVGDRRSENKSLSPERRKQLDALGFVWNVRAQGWEKGFQYLTIYKERERHCRVPNRHVENGFQLGQWAQHQRQKKDRLSEECRSLLDTIGFVWDVLEADWQEGFRYLTIYKEREGHCRVPALYNENGFPLGAWVSRQRQRQECISPERRHQLDALGFIWDVLEADWEEGFRYLRIFWEREGHCHVPDRHVDDGFRLGQWVRGQRDRKITMPEDRQQRLDALGFIWDVLETNWAEGFHYLKMYKKREGDCNVPGSHIENDFRLGQWVSIQRRAQVRETLSHDRRQSLNDLGFIWGAKRPTR